MNFFDYSCGNYIPNKITQKDHRGVRQTTHVDLKQSSITVPVHNVINFIQQPRKK